MKNGQLKPGYNVTIGVEAEYITGANITSERSDQLTLIPLLDKMSKNLTKKYESVTADAGFESEENYTYLKNNNQTAYIKPQIYDKSKTRKFKRDISKRDRINRSIQVEGAFGIIKQDANFRRFLMRGKKNVFIEILLMAFGFDINKLHNKTMQNRNGQLLHKQQIS